MAYLKYLNNLKSRGFWWGWGFVMILASSYELSKSSLEQETQAEVNAICPYTVPTPAWVHSAPMDRGIRSWKEEGIFFRENGEGIIQWKEEIIRRKKTHKIYEGEVHKF